MRRFTPLAGLCLLMVLGRSMYCQDWPTYMHDGLRSGSSPCHNWPATKHAGGVMSLIVGEGK